MPNTLSKAITPTTLFEDIQEFLARQSQENSADGPYVLPIKNGTELSPSPKSSDASETPVGQNISPLKFLPYCTLGKGERSIHFLLFRFLVCRGHCVIPEFPLDGRDSLDLLVLDERDEPMAAIELKHYSVHQTNGVGQLLNTEVPLAVAPSDKKKQRKPSLDGDYDKRKFSAVKWASGSRSLIANKTSDDIGIVIPLVQIGLLTAICSPSGGANHPAAFLRSYVKGKAITKSNSSNSYYSVPRIVGDWYANHQKNSRYSKGIWGWGPVESFFLLAQSPPWQPNSFPVVGRVGYVCVMTK